MKNYKDVSIWIIAALIVCGCGNNQIGSIANYPIGAEIKSYDGIEGLEKVIVRGADGRILSEGDFLNGVNHGIWVEYNSEKGTPISIKSYFNGNLQGVSMEFSNGNLISRVNYSGNQLDGTKVTLENGSIVSEEEYSNGVLNGMVRRYYKGGVIMEEAPYANGIIHGLAKWYDEDGNLKFQYEYSNGELVDRDP